MRKMNYQATFTQSDDEVAYAVANGPTEHDITEGNSDYPSLTIESDRERDVEKLYEVLASPEYDAYDYAEELSSATISELKFAIQGKPSSWKLTAVTVDSYRIMLDFHNFGRQQWLHEIRSSDLTHDEIDRIEKTSETDHVWCTLTGRINFTVKEYSKKGKVKRRTNFVCSSDYGSDEAPGGRCLVTVIEYTGKKKHLERELCFCKPDKNTDLDLVIDIMEHKR